MTALQELSLRLSLVTRSLTLSTLRKSTGHLYRRHRSLHIRVSSLSSSLPAVKDSYFPVLLFSRGSCRHISAGGDDLKLGALDRSDRGPCLADDLSFSYSKTSDDEIDSPTQQLLFSDASEETEDTEVPNDNSKFGLAGDVIYVQKDRRTKKPQSANYLTMSDKQLFSKCRMDTYRASGPGGQHRNKTDSAVRLTHIATGLVSQKSSLLVGRIFSMAARSNSLCRFECCEKTTISVSSICGSGHGSFQIAHDSWLGTQRMKRFALAYGYSPCILAADDRSQHINRSLALTRLRQIIALEIRDPVELDGYKVPPELVRILPSGTGGKRGNSQRIGPNHPNFILTPGNVLWKQLQVDSPGMKALMDLLYATGGSVSDAGKILGLTTGAMSKLITSNDLLWQGVNKLRSLKGLRPLR